ncbi:MAG: TonB-dependent receptor plug domain-containing protein, partial [Bacteroidota bacterium]|nr:TonB-dependent receptor plug domain-containing protein [Bacteroidota bacterium]
MKTIQVLIVLFVCVCGISQVFAQHSSSSLTVRVDTAGLKITNAFRIQLIEKSSRNIVQETRLPSSNEVIFHDVPYATYTIVLLDGQTVVARESVTINSGVPSRITIGAVRKIEAGEITVEGIQTGEITPGTHSYYSEKQIENLPSFAGPKKIESVLLNTTGAVPDEDGRLHFRGEDAQLQYVVDGIPVTTNSTRIYSSLFNSNLIKSVDVQRGALNAEYGIATSAIVEINTRSGFDAPLFADGVISYGSYGTRDRSLSLGGNIGGRVAIFASYASSETDRYLDPIRGFTPNHTDGYTHNYFGKADFLISDNLDLILLGATNLTNFAIANESSTRQPPQDQREDLSDYMYGARLNYTINDNSTISGLVYDRHLEATNTSGGLLQINSPADSIKAIRENEEYFIGAHRVDAALGGQVEYAALTRWFDVPNAVKLGVGGESFPLQEFFTFAVTDPRLSNSDSAGGDSRLLPYDITQGGKPFSVDQSKGGMRFSIYAQDHLNFDNLVIDAGLRYDLFKLIESESGISPRLAAAYKLTKDLWIKGAYNRIIMQAPVENILVSSSEEAARLVGASQGATPTTVMAEREHVAELGTVYKLNDNLDVELNGYAKFIDNFIVKVELGVSGVIFPVNLKQGRVLGGDLEFRLHNWNNFSGKLSLSTCDSRGLKPDDGSSPIAAGLILGEEGNNYNKPFAGEDAFQTEHNQLLTASFILNYDHPSGFIATLGGRFDSGLPFDLADSNGVGLDAEQSKVELKKRGYSDEVIDLLNLNSDMPGSPDKSTAAHVVFDLSAGYDFQKTMGFPAKLVGTILNILDTKYLYKFESVFGGTHF